MLFAPISVAREYLSVRATPQNIDRQDDTLSYRITYEGKSSVPVESIVSKLKKDFEIIERDVEQKKLARRNEYITRTNVSLRLKPKTNGEFSIPPLTIGEKSSEEIKVLVDIPEPPKTATQLYQDKAFFVEVSADNFSPYVESQVVFTIKVYDSINLTRIKLKTLGRADLPLKILADKKEYLEQKNNKSYTVSEYRALFIPQTVGNVAFNNIEVEADLQIPYVRGAKIAAEGASPDPRFKVVKEGASYRIVAFSAAPLTLNVQPIPPEFQHNKKWVPARNLSISSTFLKTSDININEGVEWNVIVSGEGVNSKTLPNIVAPKIDGARVFEKTSSESDELIDTTLTAKKNKTFVIFPEKGGQIKVPPLKIAWFDTTTQTAKEARTLEQILIVRPPSKALAPISEEDETSFNPSLLLILAVVVILALVALTALITSKYIKNKIEEMRNYEKFRAEPLTKEEPENVAAPPPQAAPPGLANTASLSPKGLTEAIVKIMNKSFSSESFLNVKQVANFLGHKQFSAEMDRLDRAVYSKEKATFNNQAIIDALQTLIAEKLGKK